MIAALALAAALPSQTLAPLTPAQCADPADQRTAWGEVAKALEEGDTAGASLAMDRMIACGEGPFTVPPRTVRADIASKAGDDALVVKLLSPIPIPAGPIGPQAAWLLLRTYAKLGDQEAFLAQRDRLMAATDKALGDPAGPAKGKLVERFKVGTIQVAAYQANVVHGPDRRLFEFILLDGKPTAQPESILFTNNEGISDMAAQTGARTPIYVDRYQCDIHVVVRAMTGIPTYDQARAVVVDELTRHPDSSTIAEPVQAGQGQGCTWPVFTSPGVGF